MRIIVTQTEIEQAIKNFVLSQMSLAEGQDIKITLKATRGEDGTTAEVDVVLASVAQPQKSKPVTRSATTAVAQTAAAEEEVVEVPQTPETENTAEEAPVAEQDPTEPASAGTGEATSTSTVGGETAVSEADAAPKRSSLFKNLTKPVND